MRRIIITIVAVVTALGAVAPAAQAKVHQKRVAEGLHVITIKERNPRLHVRVVRIRPKAKVAIRTGLAQGRLPGLERTSSLARRRGALVAVNGDYADRSGRPMMTFAHRGKLVQTPLSAGRNFAIARDRRTSYIGVPKVRVELMPDGAEAPIAIPRVNNGPPKPRMLALHTPAGGNLERPPRRNSCSSRLLPTSSPRIDGLALQIGYKVAAVRCGAGRMGPGDGVTLSARRNTPVSPVVKGLVRGQAVSLRWSLGWEKVHETVGGNPTLVENGRIVVGRSSHPFFRRHPRTGVGFTGNGTVLLVTADGRWRKSVGMTLRGFARVFKRYGATWALNLDGGGSTTMVVRGKVVNRPSDRRERPVSSALLVMRKGGGAIRMAATGEEDPAPSVAWRDTVSDPASTGGLAAALVDEGREVPEKLREAAAGFRASAQGRGRPSR